MYHATEAETNEFYRGITVNSHEYREKDIFYTHVVYQYRINADCDIGFDGRNVLSSDGIRICKALINGESCAEADKEIAARMVEYGYLENRNGKLTVLIPAFTRQQKLKFDEIARSGLSVIAEDYRKSVLELANEFTALFPQHVLNDARRFSAWMYMWVCGFIARYGLENGRFKSPPAGSACDVLIEEKV